MNTGEYPEYFARFYDLIYHQLRDSADKAYFLEKIRQAKGRILEVGTGTGRLFTEALAGGADIYGIDISPYMLEILRKKLPDHEQFRVSRQNILDFGFDFGFQLVVAPFRVMMHLADKQDQIRALNHVYSKLEEGGSFIFDAFVPDLNQLIKGHDHETDFDGEYEPGKRVKRIVSTYPDLINQLINVEFRFDWNDEHGDKTAVWLTPLRFFFRFELEHLIERSDFKTYHIFGDYHDHELGSETREFVVVCTK